MVVFHYKAKDKFGVSVSGLIEAASKEEAVYKLNVSAMIPLFLEAKEEEGYLSQADIWMQRFEKVKAQELIVFVSQLSSILKAGIPLMECLDAIAPQIKSNKLKRIIMEVKRRIEGGSSFSDALAAYPDTFSVLIISMVRVGEAAGGLDEVLDRVGNILEKEEMIGQKIKSATRYPMFVLFFLGMAFIAVVTFIIPRFMSLFQSQNIELPLPTKILIGANYAITHYWYLLLLALGILFFAFRKVLQSAEGRLQWEKILFSLPVFGSLLNKLALSRFTRALAAMLKSGIPIVEALSISAQVSGNSVVAQVVERVRGEIIKGNSFADQLRGSSIFPSLVVQMVAIGEKSGNLEEMLLKVSDYFDRDTDFTISNLTTIIEPMLIVGLTGLVALLAMGVILPMWSLYSGILK
ncbi:MAG: type II secretion system F family protein [Candidatus Saganbacteria bacterium]|nr:type II secretion system F family protein [Candidatus Saganbacteria bacterium]